MGEAIISRAFAPGIELPAITQGYCSILAIVRDTKGALMQNMHIHCKDGENWYNYITNEKGQALFMTNSGAANITAWNFTNEFVYIDINKTLMNVDAPVGTSKFANITMDTVNGYHSYFSLTSNAMAVSKTVGFSGNAKFRLTNQITGVNVFGGGGGGGGVTTYNNKSSGIASGGGGGYVNGLTSLSINKNSLYTFIIGSGGAGGVGTNRQNNENQIASIGGTGGTSVAFGLSANGATGGCTGLNISITGRSSSRGIGGTGNGVHLKALYNNFNVSGINSKYNYGGGGGGGYDRWQSASNPDANEILSMTGGTPYGGGGGYWSAWEQVAGTAGTKAGGGGAGSYGSSGCSGGAGVIEFTIP